MVARIRSSCFRNLSSTIFIRNFAQKKEGKKRVPKGRFRPYTCGEDAAIARDTE